jgi:hypothetical protein
MAHFDSEFKETTNGLNAGLPMKADQQRSDWVIQEFGWGEAIAALFVVSLNSLSIFVPPQGTPVTSQFGGAVRTFRVGFVRLIHGAFRQRI